MLEKGLEVLEGACLDCSSSALAHTAGAEAEQGSF